MGGRGRRECRHRRRREPRDGRAEPGRQRRPRVPDAGDARRIARRRFDEPPGRRRLARRAALLGHCRHAAGARRQAADPGRPGPALPASLLRLRTPPRHAPRAGASRGRRRSQLVTGTARPPGRAVLRQRRAPGRRGRLAAARRGAGAARPAHRHQRRPRHRQDDHRRQPARLPDRAGPRLPHRAGRAHRQGRRAHDGRDSPARATPARVLARQDADGLVDGAPAAGRHAHRLRARRGPPAGHRRAGGRRGLDAGPGARHAVAGGGAGDGAHHPAGRQGPARRGRIGGGVRGAEHRPDPHRPVRRRPRRDDRHARRGHRAAAGRDAQRAAGLCRLVHAELPLRARLGHRPPRRLRQYRPGARGRRLAARRQRRRRGVAGRRAAGHGRPGVAGDGRRLRALPGSRRERACRRECDHRGLRPLPRAVRAA